MNTNSQFSGRSHARAGFTLLQLMLSIAIIAVLAAILFSVSGAIQRRAEKAKCISNMKNIGAALGSYTTINGYWPQMPEGLASDKRKFWKFWMNVLAPDIEAEMWICPSVLAASLDEDSGEPEFGSYVPTDFDARSASHPWRYGKQPWLVETGNHHGDGQHVLYPDGSVQSFGSR